MTTKKITMDVWKNEPVTVTANLGEVDSRFLEVSFKDGESSFDLSGKTVTIYAKKPDGNVIYNNCVITQASEGVATVGLTSQTSAVSGVLDCEFHILGSQDDLLKVCGLQIVVYDRYNVGSAVESESELDAIAGALSEANRLLETYSSPAFIREALGISFGSWTPQLSAREGTAPTYSVQYSMGSYYTIGRLVYIVFHGKYDITDAGTGYACVSGLPYKALDPNVGGHGLSTIEVSRLSQQPGGAAFVADGTNQVNLQNISGEGAQNWVTGTLWLGYSGCYLRDFDEE